MKVPNIFQHLVSIGSIGPDQKPSRCLHQQGRRFLRDGGKNHHHRHRHRRGPKREIKSSDCDGNDGATTDICLYLIRHGEAQHNVREKIAMKHAKRSSMEEHGYEEDHPETLRRMDEARRSVLNDEALRDAKLSENGRHEAEQARKTLQRIIEQKHQQISQAEYRNETNAATNRNDDKLILEQPRYVLVSPLTRTLETADIIFPAAATNGDTDTIQRRQHRHEIHVRDEIIERKTGKPPDERSSTYELNLRKSFQRFNMNNLKSLQLLRSWCNNSIAGGSDGSGGGWNDLSESFFDDDCCDDDESVSTNQRDVLKNSAIRSSDSSDSNSSTSNNNNDTTTTTTTNTTGNSSSVPNDNKALNDPKEPSEEEDKVKLRERTEQLFSVLLNEILINNNDDTVIDNDGGDNDDDDNDNSGGSSSNRPVPVAVVSHKGYLRELERGPLQQPDAKEFANCEIRVYRVRVQRSPSSSEKNQRLIYAERIR